MQSKELEFLKTKITEANGRELEISEDFLRVVIDGSREFLSKHPLDLLTKDFSRDLAPLGEYLKVKFVPSFPGKYLIVPVS